MLTTRFLLMCSRTTPTSRPGAGPSRSSATRAFALRLVVGCAFAAATPAAAQSSSADGPAANTPVSLGDVDTPAARAGRADADIRAQRLSWADEDVRALFFGMPSEAQLASLAERAAAVERLAAKGEAELDAALADAERRGDFDDESKRDSLDRAVIVSSVVLPLARARAAVIDAAVTLGPLDDVASGDGRATESLVAAFTTIERVRPVSAWSEAERATTLAASAMLFGRDRVAAEAARSALAAIQGDDRLRAAASRREPNVAGVQRAAALILARLERRERGWAAGAAAARDVPISTREQLALRLRFGGFDAAEARAERDARVAGERLAAAAEPIARLQLDAATREQAGLTLRELTDWLARAAQAAPARTLDEGLTLAVARAAASRGERDAAIDVIETLVRRRGGSPAEPMSPRNALEQPFCDTLWAMLTNLRIDRALDADEPAGWTARVEASTRDALAIARASLEPNSPRLTSAAASALVNATNLAWTRHGDGVTPTERATDGGLRRALALAVVGEPGVRLGIDGTTRDYWRARLAIAGVRAALHGRSGDVTDLSSEGRAIHANDRADVARRRAALDEALGHVASFEQRGARFAETLGEIGVALYTDLARRERSRLDRLLKMSDAIARSDDDAMFGIVRASLRSLAAIAALDGEAIDGRASKATLDEAAEGVGEGGRAAATRTLAARARLYRAWVSVTAASVDGDGSRDDGAVREDARDDAGGSPPKFAKTSNLPSDVLSPRERIAALHVAARLAVRAGDAAGARQSLRELDDADPVSGGVAAREAFAAVLLEAARVFDDTRAMDEAAPTIGMIDAGGDGDGDGDDAAVAVLLADRLTSDRRSPLGLASRSVVALINASEAASARRFARRLVERGAPTERKAVWLDLLLADAQLADGDRPAAFAAYRQVVTATPAERRRERAYWHASARMLSVLTAENADGSRTDVIRREVNRLKLQDSWGMHADCCAIIDAVGKAVGVR